MNYDFVFNDKKETILTNMFKDLTMLALFSDERGRWECILTAKVKTIFERKALGYRQGRNSF